MLLESHFRLGCRSNDLCLDDWRSNDLCLDDWMMVKNASNQRGANSVTVALCTHMLVASKAVLLENYLAFSSWILNGSSIECHEKKHQPLILSGVRFGSRAIQISG